MKTCLNQAPASRNETKPFFGHQRDKDGFFQPRKGISRKPNVSSGQDQASSLPANTQKEMGAGLGHDFSQVKIHTGDHARAMNESQNAHALTYGNDIYFNSSKYNPDSADGKLLLAHELAHTVQQKAKRAPATESEDALEKNANDQASGMLIHSGKTPSPDNKGNSGGNAGVKGTGLRIQRCARAPNPPSTMTWVVVNNLDGPGPGGWKTCTTTVGFLASMPIPRNVVCPLTIGVPLVNRLGPVSDQFASDICIAAIQEVGQEMAAEMSGEDPEHIMPNDVICIEYRQRLQVAIGASIPGARVSRL
jgi:hypothetical protein